MYSLARPHGIRNFYRTVDDQDTPFLYRLINHNHAPTPLLLVRVRYPVILLQSEFDRTVEIPHRELADMREGDRTGTTKW